MVAQSISSDELNTLLHAYPKDRRYALAAMQDMQRRFSYVPREGLEALAAYLERPFAELYSMATFYKALSLEPKGRHIIKVCDGTACHIRGSANIINCLCRELEASPGGTTRDGEFSINLVNCVGACALAPVMIIDDEYFGSVTQQSLPGVLETVRGRAAFSGAVAPDDITPDDTATDNASLSVVTMDAQAASATVSGAVAPDDAITYNAAPTATISNFPATSATVSGVVASSVATSYSAISNTPATNASISSAMASNIATPGAAAINSEGDI